MDPNNHLVLYKMGQSYPFEKGHWSSRGKLHLMAHHYKVRIPRRLISDNRIPFINKDMKNMIEASYIKHGRSTPYYPQGNGQAEANTRVLLKILKKMKHEYEGEME